MYLKTNAFIFQSSVKSATETEGSESIDRPLVSIFAYLIIVYEMV